MFDEYFQKSVVSPVHVVAALRPADPTGTPSSTSIDQDAPSASTSQTQEILSPVIHPGVEEHINENEPVQLDNDSFLGIFSLILSFEEFCSRGIIPSNVHPLNPPFEHLSKWIKNHTFDNVIGNPSRPISTRRQLQTDAMWCYFDALLTSVEPKNYQETLKESCWINVVK
nr:hypothetical protein [Tanacetum cinerariifolium]